MAARKLRNYVNGEWREPEGCEWLDVENPSTREVIAQVPLSSTAETERAIAAAKAAFPAWAALAGFRKREHPLERYPTKLNHLVG